MEFYSFKDIKSDTIVASIKDILVRLQLDIKKLRGQTYDGASNILGKKSEVATQIQRIQLKAKQNHCHGHTLNHAVKDLNNGNEVLRNTLSTVTEICIPVKYSPKRENILGEIRDNIDGRPKMVSTRLHPLLLISCVLQDGPFELVASTKFCLTMKL